MKTSVILTTYNRPDALLKVLEGLRHQTRIPGEVIVADDGSGLETLEMLSAFRMGSPYPLFHVRQEDRGFRVARIRNKAILKSTGDYIVLLDGDCIPEKHFIEDHLCLSEKGFFFQGKRILISKRLSDDFTHETVSGAPVSYIFSRDISNSHHLIRLPFFPSFSSTRLSGIRSCNMGFFREDIFAVNGFNENFTGWGREDSELAVRFYHYGLKRKEQPFRAICFHLWHPENPRERLSLNDELLQEAIGSKRYECKNGLVQK